MEPIQRRHTADVKPQLFLKNPTGSTWSGSSLFYTIMLKPSHIKIINEQSNYAVIQFENGREYLLYKTGEIASCNYKNTGVARLLHQFPDSDGYLSVKMLIMDKWELVRIHRLMAMVFLPNPNNYSDVNHKDENKTNNNLTNLEWCTRTYNVKYGTHMQRSGKTRSKPIAQLKDGKIVKIWNSLTEAAHNGFNIGCIGAVLSKKPKYAHITTHKGFEWEYV